MEATILCLGIYEETGSLLYASTTPKDLMAVAYLLRRGANLNIVSNFLKVELSKEEFDLLNELLRSIREIVVQGVRVKIAKGAMEGFGDVAHLAHKIMDMEDTDAVALLIGMADKILIVARSKVPELDMGRVLSVFGGGGHPSPASATIKDIPFEIVEERQPGRPVITHLECRPADEAALQGVLDTLFMLGMRLILVESLPAAG